MKLKVKTGVSLSMANPMQSHRVLPYPVILQFSMHSSDCACTWRASPTCATGTLRCACTYRLKCDWFSYLWRYQHLNLCGRLDYGVPTMAMDAGITRFSNSSQNSEAFWICQKEQELPTFSQLVFDVWTDHILHFVLSAEMYFGQLFSSSCF